MTIGLLDLARQGVLGLVNGAFYALLALGFAVIFGLLGIVNFVHGTLYMLGAFAAWALLAYAGLGFWWALVLAPIAVGAVGYALERTLIRRVAGLDPLYGLLLTYGIAIAIDGELRQRYGSTGLAYDVPEALTGVVRLGFMAMPRFRLFAVGAAALTCFVVWFAIERTRLGARLRAAAENPSLLRAFGVDVPRLVALAYAGGAALAGLAGVLAAPIVSVNPGMGEDAIITVFAIVVIGGMGSIAGAVLGGFGMGVLEGFTKVFYPEASATVIFVAMTLVLLARPQGLFGRTA